MATSHTGQVATRALSILSCFTVARPRATLTELSEQTGLPLATTLRHLRALEAAGYVVVNGAKEYSLGPEVTRLTGVVLALADTHGLRDAAEATMREVHDLTEETVGLFQRIGDVRICVAELPSPHALRLGAGVGRSIPLPGGAAGKVLIAWSPQEEVDRLMARPTAVSAGTVTADDLAEIRDRGYAVSFEEVVPGASGLAVPIFAGETVIGAITVGGPITRLTQERIHRLAPAIKAATERLSRDLSPNRAAASR